MDVQPSDHSMARNIARIAAPTLALRCAQFAFLAAAVALAGCEVSPEMDIPGDLSIPDRPLPYVKNTPYRPSLSVSFTTIALGARHTCGLVADGRTFCMGFNEYDQLGTVDPMQRCVSGQIPCTPTPLPVSTGARFSLLGLDQNHSCGLTAEGEAYCWGFGLGGQLGDGLRVNSQTPVKVATTERFRAISQGRAAFNTCAITTAGQVYCWGIGADGQNGNGGRDVALTPIPIASSVRMKDVGMGQGFGCALSENGEIFCWGQNTYGKLGTGVPGASLIPVLVAGGRQYTAIAVGGQHACALDRDRGAWCWGSMPSVGSAASAGGAPVPQAVDGGRRYIAISAGSGHTCALDEDRAAWCWGPNGGGLLGDGTDITQVRPVQVASNLRYRQISAGGTATCGIVDDGTLACWGTNLYGQMGFTPGDP